MNRGRLPTLLLLALTAACGKPSAPPSPAAAPQRKVDAVEEAASSYRVAAAISPAGVARGGRATLAIEIEIARPDVHVQREFPLKVALTSSDGLALGKAVLGHGDALDGAAKGRRWEVPVTATAAGPQHAEASLRFAVCKETEPAWCVTRSETLRAGVEVR